MNKRSSRSRSKKRGGTLKKYTLKHSGGYNWRKKTKKRRKRKARRKK